MNHWLLLSNTLIHSITELSYNIYGRWCNVICKEQSSNCCPATLLLNAGQFWGSMIRKGVTFQDFRDVCFVFLNVFTVLYWCIALHCRLFKHEYIFFRSIKSIFFIYLYGTCITKFFGVVLLASPTFIHFFWVGENSFIVVTWQNMQHHSYIATLLKIFMKMKLISERW